MELTKQELENRKQKFCTQMDRTFPDWDTALIISKVNQYYFTGTMQDAVLFIHKGGRLSYYVRQSYQRAAEESPIPSCVHAMGSYRDAAEAEGSKLGNTYIEAESMPCAMLERIQKYFHTDKIGSLEVLLRMVRSVKSPYELHWMREAGKQHHKVLAEAIPSILKEGMSEAELIGLLQDQMIRYGHQGIARFHKFQTEISTGQIGFGENSLYPTCFDGPGGALGMYPAVPIGGNPNRKLKKGDLVFVDMGFGMNGYHTDATQIYMFGAKPSQAAMKYHQDCLDIQNRTAELLKPGNIPSEIYNTILDSLDEEFKVNFMGYKDRAAKFLGHGVGLHVDELPVIAQGFDQPLEEGMTFALEPKKGIEGVGMVGVEDTFVVTPSGGECITTGNRPIILV